MRTVYESGLDLNLLRVFALVAETGSVTESARRLYITQPAVSAALRRLADHLEAPVFVRRGRHLQLTHRGQMLREALNTHFVPLLSAVNSTPSFDPATSERTFRVGLSDSAEMWLLGPLLKYLQRTAPHVRIISLPVQFRTVGAALESGLDAAISVADELPAGTMRRALRRGKFVCLVDANHFPHRSISNEQYFKQRHVVVSYNGDLRGIVEDELGRARDVQCAVSNFHALGTLISGSPLVATVPELVANELLPVWPGLRSLPLPFQLPSGTIDLLWPATSQDDPASQFLRSAVLHSAKAGPRD